MHHGLAQYSVAQQRFNNPRARVCMCAVVCVCARQNPLTTAGEEETLSGPEREDHTGYVPLF